MINSRVKGAAAEREVATILNAALGSNLVRNLEQTRSGGYDLVDDSGVLDKYAIEVKRYSKITTPMIVGFWQQCVEQAQQADKEPVLIYRQNRDEWRVVVRLSWFVDESIGMAFVHHPKLSFDYSLTATISIDAFCQLATGGAE